MAQHAALNTKVMALKAKTLSREDYDHLIEAESLPDVVRYLKDNTTYGKYLKDLDPEKAHRSDVEAALSRYQLDDTEKLLHYLDNADKDMLKIITMRADIESLNILIRALAKGEDLRDVKNSLVYSSTYSKIPWNRLIEADDWDQFKEALKGTPYYRRLEVFDSVSLSKELFQIEKSLERYYYDHLKKVIGKLSGKDEKKLVQALREGIDLENLVWIYRGKKFYHLKPDTLLTYSLLGGEKVSQQDLVKLAGITDEDELLDALEKFADYDFLFRHDVEDRDLHMERRVERYMYYKFRHLLQSSGVSKAFAYLKLLQYEMQDIISIIEGKRYNLSPAEMERYLIYDMHPDD